MSPLSTY